MDSESRGNRIMKGVSTRAQGPCFPREERIVVAEREFTAILTPDLEGGGYTMTCKEIPAAISQAETIQDALDNIADAIELCMWAEAELRNSQVQAK